MLVYGFQKAANMYQERDILKGDPHLHEAVMSCAYYCPAQKLSVSDQQDRNAAQLAVCASTIIIFQI